MDYILLGKQLYYYKEPHKNEVEGFEVSGIAKEKIAELESRLKEITARNDTRKELLQLIKDPYFQFHADFWFYEFLEEKTYIEKWLYYWKSFLPNKQTKTSSNWFSDDQIRQAEQYPINQLYIGSLRQTSGKQVGLCPFHQEKTPSFTIFPGNTFYCFGCQKSGNSINFLMESKNLGFVDAVRELL